MLGQMFDLRRYSVVLVVLNDCFLRLGTVSWKDGKRKWK